MEIYDIMRFWAEKGVQGFRLDAFQFISKDTSFPKLSDEYEEDFSQIIPYHGMGPHLHDYLREMNDEILKKFLFLQLLKGQALAFRTRMTWLTKTEKSFKLPIILN